MTIDEKRLAEIRVELCDDCGWRGHDELVSAEIGWWPTCGHPRAEPPEGHAFLPILRDDDDPAPPEGCPLRNGSRPVPSATSRLIPQVPQRSDPGGRAGSLARTLRSMRTTTQAPTLISIATFASMGGFSRSTARRLVASGAISAVRVGRKTLRVPLEEAQRLLTPVSQAHRPL